MRAVLGFLIWLILIILLGIPLTILKIYKLLLHAITIRRNTKDEKWLPLSDLDSPWASDASWVKSHINIGFFLKLKRNQHGKHFTVQELRERFFKVFLDKILPGGRYSNFTSYIAPKGGYMFRVETESVDLEKHILQLKWKNNGRNQCLEDILTKWWAQKWEERKPCWQMILIENLPTDDKPDELVLAFKIHHSFADGYSLLHILDRLTGCTSPYNVRDFEETTLTKIRDVFQCIPYLHRLKGFPPEHNPFRVHLNKSNFYEFILSFTSFPLESINAIMKKYNVHDVSVIFAIIIGGLRRYAEMKSDARKIPKKFGFVTTIPWPRHPSRDLNTPNVDKICNHWSVGNGKVAFDEKDPIQRMKQIECELETFKNLGLSKFVNRVIVPAKSTLPYFANKLFSVDMGYGAVHRSLSGGKKYCLMGCDIEQIYPLASPQDSLPHIPVLCLTFSHAGVMDMTVKFHTSVVKDQETANMISQKLFRKEFDSLTESLNFVN